MNNCLFAEDVTISAVDQRVLLSMAASGTLEMEEEP